MAYTRSTYRPRTTYRRKRPTYRRPYNNVRMMQRVAQRVVNRNVEHKYYDTNFSLTPQPTAIQLLTDINQSDTDTGRDGDKLRMMTLKWRAQVFNADATNVVRMILFQWHPSTDLILPSPAQILQDPNNYNSMYNHDRGSNYSIFYDRIIKLNNVNQPNVIINGECKLFSKYGRLKYVRQNLKFVNSSVQGQDHLWLVLVSDSTVSPSPNFSATFRLSYTDS